MPTTISGTNGIDKVVDGTVAPIDLTNTYNTLGNYANDGAAATGGVVVGQLYRNGSILMVRVA